MPSDRYSEWIREYGSSHRVTEEVFHEILRDRRWEEERCFRRFRSSREIAERLIELYRAGRKEELIEEAYRYGIYMSYTDLVRCIRLLGEKWGLIEVKHRRSSYARPWRSWEIEKLREMREKGYSVEEIAKSLGRSVKAVYIKLSELGLYTYKSRGIVSEEEKKALCCLAQSIGIYQTSHITGRAYNTIKAHCIDRINECIRAIHRAYKIPPHEIAFLLHVNIKQVMEAIGEKK